MNNAADQMNAKSAETQPAKERDSKISRLLGAYAPFWLALASLLIYYVSLPPVGLRYTIFIVPMIWASVLVPYRFQRASRKGVVAESRGKRALLFPLRFWGRGEYRQYWLAFFVFWLATVVWVSYPHPGTILGWIALSGYLAIYLPIFVMQARALNRALKLPIWLASALSWLACEALRNVVMGGFSFAGLSHALYDVPSLIQIAEIFGEYGVGVMIVALGALFASGNRRSQSVAVILFLANFIYGRSSLQSLDEMALQTASHGARPMRVALLQDATAYRFPVPEETNRRVEESYLALAHEASEDPEGYDLIVWPEGTFPDFYFDLSCAPSSLKGAEPDAKILDGSKRYAREWIMRTIRKTRLSFANLSSRLKTPLVLGATAAVFDEEGSVESFNSAIYVPYFGTEEECAALGPEITENAPTSTLELPETTSFRRYDKVALVMFGEYVPFVDYLPDAWKIKAVCADVALGRGRGPTLFQVPSRDGAARYLVAPNVCFESSIPHFISRQMAAFRSVDLDADVLLNISSDGWFRNGAQTDLHLATMVYRAIESRRPLATATHGGFSAYIDAGGRVVAKGKRGVTQIVDARIPIVKTRPKGLLQTTRDGKRVDFCVADLLRRCGYGIFIACCVLQTVLVVINRRCDAKGDESFSDRRERCEEESL